MSYTADHLAEVRQAIVDLGTSKQVVQIRSANGKTLTYRAAQLDELQAVEARIVADLAKASSTTTRTRTRMVRTHKGL